MSKQPLLIIGAGTFASEVANIAHESGRFEPIAFLDTRPDYNGKNKLDGLPVLTLAAAEDLTPKPAAICALGTTFRGDEIDRIKPTELPFATLVHPTAHVPESVVLGDGVIIGAGVIIGHATHIGAHVVVNRGALIGHHSRIGALSIVSPGANVAARNNIGERVYLGMGSIVLDGCKIGSQVVVGAGSVVICDLPDRVEALGTPARIVKHHINGI